MKKYIIISLIALSLFITNNANAEITTSRELIINIKSDNTFHVLSNNFGDTPTLGIINNGIFSLDLTTYPYINLDWGKLTVSGVCSIDPDTSSARISFFYKDKNDIIFGCVKPDYPVINDMPSATYQIDSFTFRYYDNSQNIGGNTDSANIEYIKITAFLSLIFILSLISVIYIMRKVL